MLARSQYLRVATTSHRCTAGAALSGYQFGGGDVAGLIELDTRGHPLLVSVDNKKQWAPLTES